MGEMAAGMGDWLQSVRVHTATRAVALTLRAAEEKRMMSQPGNVADGMKMLRVGAALLAEAVRMGLPSPALRGMAEPLVDLAWETLALMSAHDPRIAALAAVPTLVRRFLKCLDDGWDQERLDAHAQLVLRAVQDL